MNPSVRSRLLASFVSFALGLGVGTYAILMIAKPDEWVWLAASVVLMLTGAVGVVVSDSDRPVSMWAILGLEVFVAFTLVPLLWTFTVATTPDGVVPQTVLPRDVSWSGFSDAFHSDVLRRAAATSAIVAGIATLVAMPLAVGAAYSLVRLPVRGRRVVHLLVLATLLAPLVAVAGPIADQLVALDAYGSRLALVPPAMLLTLPLAIWLCLTVFRDVPWSLRDAIRADGGTRRQVTRHFAVPAVLPGVAVAALLVFVAALNDVVLGAALSSGAGSRPLPATLLMASGRAEGSSAAVAAAGLLWMLPPVLLLLAFPRRVGHLLGRSYR